MMGVPALGLPKMRSLVLGMVRPAVRASPEWSMRAKSLMPLAASRVWRRATVSSTVWGVRRVWMPVVIGMWPVR